MKSCKLDTMEVGVGPSDFVLDGDPVPLPKKGAEPPNFRPMSIVAHKTPGWIKIALGVEVGLGPGHIVLDGNSTTLSKKGQIPQFWPISIVAKRLDA